MAAPRRARNHRVFSVLGALLTSRTPFFAGHATLIHPKRRCKPPACHGARPYNRPIRAHPKRPSESQDDADDGYLIYEIYEICEVCG